jgi:hypothetical protein
MPAASNPSRVRFHQVPGASAVDSRIGPMSFVSFWQSPGDGRADAVAVAARTTNAATSAVIEMSLVDICVLLAWGADRGRG